MKNLSSFHSEIIERCFRIVNRRAIEVPYRLWDHQKILLNSWIQGGTDAGHLVLKAASLGSSSLALAYGMVEICTRPDWTLVLLAHEEGLAQTLLKRAKRYIEKIQKANIPGLDFPTYNRNATDYVELSNRSVAYIETAGSNVDVGRGNPINIFIGTEVAFWKNTKLFTALIPRLPGVKIFESTANGAGGWFYKQCQKSFAGKGIYNAAFVPWFVHWEYSVQGNKIRLNDKSEEELDMQSTFGTPDNQILWRRRKIIELDADDADEGMNGEDAFRQEYPSFWEEAFLRSGSPIFGHRVYSKVEPTIMEPGFIGDILAA